jgi:predicted SprT family Zn-dependent metalloprotease
MKIFLGRGQREMTFYVTCKCGNLVAVEKRHDFSKLPCPECKKKKGK